MEKKHQSGKLFKNFLANFGQVHEEPRPKQIVALKAMAESNQLILQAPTGTGKTALGYSFLKTHCSGNQNGFYVCPNKTLVDGVVQQYPEIMPMYGRNEYPCLYYADEYQADQVPCALLKECPHRVNLETGETYELGAKPCPYLNAKYQSRKKDLVACTIQYYFYEALGRQELPHALVVDEAHDWSNSIRSMMQYQITDYTLEEFWSLLVSVDCRTEAKYIREFCDVMVETIKQYEAGRRTSLLTDDDLRSMLKVLLKLQRSNIDDKIKKAIKEKKINPRTDREILKALDEFTGSLYKYVKSLEFALEAKDRRPLSYVFGFWDKELVPGKKAQYVLNVKSYFIAALTKTKLLPEIRMSMSATIGADPKIFMQETGITGTFIDLESDFPIENTKVFMPMDVPDLSVKGMRRNDKNRTIRQILRGVSLGKKNGIRSLIIVSSEEERRKCIAFALEEGVEVITYSDDIKPREAVRIFRGGEGDVLVGTEMQYGQGIDLPGNVAGFTFYLRPGYASPDDPQAQFEERRLGNSRWALWTWRVIIKMLQVRGRTIRSVTDSGCIFLMSQQFKRFTYAGLPKWLKPAYVYTKTFDECLKDGVKLLQNK
jgi:Rad3-related DNA helicase